MLRTAEQMLQQCFIKSLSVVLEMLCVTDRWMDCHTPHQISLCYFGTSYEPINHTASFAHYAMLNRGDRWFCSYLCMLTGFLFTHKHWV